MSGPSDGPHWADDLMREVRERAGAPYVGHDAPRAMSSVEPPAIKLVHYRCPVTLRLSWREVLAVLVGADIDVVMSAVHHDGTGGAGLMYASAAEVVPAGGWAALGRVWRRVRGIVDSGPLLWRFDATHALYSEGIKMDARTR